jgi:hypothetical protein
MGGGAWLGTSRCTDKQPDRTHPYDNIDETHQNTPILVAGSQQYKFGA